MRNRFIQELTKAAELDEKIVLIVGDLGYGLVEQFADKFPKRFINVGVAEQNMIGLSAGMASEGYHVFVYSIANFPTFRCAEQIRNDVAYHELPVTIVAVGGGLAYGNLGYSHHAVQDYGLMRMLPNLLIAAPGDPVETSACVNYLLQNPQPSYLRLGKSGEQTFHTSIPTLEPGIWQLIKKGNKTGKVILTTGASLQYAMQNSKIEDTVFSLPLWGMCYKNLQNMQLQDCAEVTTIEDHLVDCGFGSWLLEAAMEAGDCESKIKVIGLNPKVCGLVADQKTLNECGGLNQLVSLK